MQTRNRQPAFVLLPLVLAVSAAGHTQAQEATGGTDWSHDVGVAVGNEYNDNIHRLAPRRACRQGATP